MKITQQIENILRVSRQARNSDRELLIIYMQKFGVNLTPVQIDKMKDMPAFETITRCRRQLQEQGKYPADEEVGSARFNKYKAVKEGINSTRDPIELLESRGYRLV